MQDRQSMRNAGGEGEGEGNTQGQSLVLVQLSRGRAAGDRCNMCGKTDGHACTSDVDGSKGEGGRRGWHSTGSVLAGGEARHGSSTAAAQQADNSSNNKAAAAAAASAGQQQQQDGISSREAAAGRQQQRGDESGTAARKRQQQSGGGSSSTAAAAATAGRQRLQEQWGRGRHIVRVRGGGAHTVTWLVVKAIACTGKADQLDAVLCKRLCKRGIGLLEKLGELGTQRSSARACKNEVRDSLNVLMAMG